MCQLIQLILGSHLESSVVPLRRIPISEKIRTIRMKPTIRWERIHQMRTTITYIEPEQRSNSVNRKIATPSSVALIFNIEIFEHRYYSIGSGSTQDEFSPPIWSKFIETDKLVLIF